MNAKPKIKKNTPPMPKDKPSPDLVVLRDKVTYPGGRKDPVVYPPGTPSGGRPVGAG